MSAFQDDTVYDDPDKLLQFDPALVAIRADDDDQLHRLGLFAATLTHYVDAVKAKKERRDNGPSREGKMKIKVEADEDEAGPTKSANC